MAASASVPGRVGRGAATTVSSSGPLAAAASDRCCCSKRICSALDIASAKGIEVLAPRISSMMTPMVRTGAAAGAGDGAGEKEMRGE